MNSPQLATGVASALAYSVLTLLMPLFGLIGFHPDKSWADAAAVVMTIGFGYFTHNGVSMPSVADIVASVRSDLGKSAAPVAPAVKASLALVMLGAMLGLSACSTPPVEQLVGKVEARIAGCDAASMEVYCGAGVFAVALELATDRVAGDPAAAGATLGLAQVAVERLAVWQAGGDGWAHTARWDLDRAALAMLKPVAEKDLGVLVGMVSLTPSPVVIAGEVVRLAGQGEKGAAMLADLSVMASAVKARDGAPTEADMAPIAQRIAANLARLRR